MDIYQVIGGFVILFFFCLGVAAVTLLAIYGVYRLAERHEIGTVYEHVGIRDALARQSDSIPGVKL